ncbi:hypothetical protein BDW67DRAFT_184755 [Aspergillus spinulosporus]
MAHIERLTPLDVAMPRTYIRVLLLFRAAIAASAAQTLQDGLNRLAEQVPWVSGRIYSVSGGGQEIRYDAEKINPPLLVDKGSIAASCTMSHGKSMDAIAPEVWPVSGALTGDGAPVFAASVFRFATPDLDPQEGRQCIALCVCIHHNAVDATGFTEIIRLWARNVAGPDLSFSTCSAAPDRGSRHAHLLTTLSSELKELEISSPSSDAILAMHSEYSKTPPAMPPNGLAPCTSKLFSIPIHWVNILKELLRKYVSTPPTTNVVLCALLWTTITRVRARRNPSLMSQTSRLVTAINGRPRIKPGFSSSCPVFVSENDHTYLGNAVVYVLTPFPAVALASSTAETTPDPGPAPMRSLAIICDQISNSQSVSTINKRHIAEVYRLLDESPLFPGWDLFGSRDVVITSWADQDLYTVDFGSLFGRPTSVVFPPMEPGAPADGVGIVLPRRREKAEMEILEVILMLRVDDMRALEDDSLWQTIVSV